MVGVLLFVEVATSPPVFVPTAFHTEGKVFPYDLQGFRLNIALG